MQSRQLSLPEYKPKQLLMPVSGCERPLRRARERKKPSVMKNKPFRLRYLAVLMGLTLSLPIVARAGGNTGQTIARFEPAKSVEQIESLKEGDTVVKVCRACKVVTLVRVEKDGKGIYDIAARKCEDCGSDDTYVAITKSPVPFKEQTKR
jgi:hypothetical protein